MSFRAFCLFQSVTGKTAGVSVATTLYSVVLRELVGQDKVGEMSGPMQILNCTFKWSSSLSNS